MKSFLTKITLRMKLGYKNLVERMHEGNYLRGFDQKKKFFTVDLDLN